jgi:hypothetical protein
VRESRYSPRSPAPSTLSLVQGDDDNLVARLGYIGRVLSGERGHDFLADDVRLLSILFREALDIFRSQGVELCSCVLSLPLCVHHTILPPFERDTPPIPAGRAAAGSAGARKREAAVVRRPSSAR